jgi:hypothetical protein
MEIDILDAMHMESVNQARFSADPSKICLIGHQHQRWLSVCGDDQRPLGDSALSPREILIDL